MNFTFSPLDLPGAWVVRAQAFEDGRGWFKEAYRQSAFAEAGLSDVFVQDNVSRSVGGVLRGLHYQLPPFDQAKLVSVWHGEIFDVIVDVRKDAATFGEWAGVRLSAARGEMLYVPTGFAHGFLVTSDEAIVSYKCTHEYAREYERGIAWDDPAIGIDWPLPVAHPVLSEKDRALPMLAAAQVPEIGRS